METQIVTLEAIANFKEKPQDQQELSNVTYKQQIQQHHQVHQNNEQKFLKNTKQSRITIFNFKIRGSSNNYKKNENNNNEMENNNSNISRNYNINLGSSDNNNNNKNYIVINQKQSL